MKSMGIFAICLVTCFAWGSAHADTEFGAHLGAGCNGRAKIPTFETFVGRRLERTVDALSQAGWRQLESSIDWVIPCWRGSGLKLTLSVPMLPENGGSLRDALSVSRDATWRHVARVLVKNGFSDATVRIGWEFNGDWMPWAASKDPEAYVLLFRRIVTVMRRETGAQFRFEWTPNHLRHAIDPPLAYPGDDVVDVIGMDVYDEIWDPRHLDPEERFRWYLTAPYGLDWHLSFAQAHHKLTAYSEWGTGTRPDGHGGEDNPVFVAGMADWIKVSRPAYQSYWNYPSREFDTLLSDGRRPRAAAVFVAQFGRRGSTMLEGRDGRSDAGR